MSVILSQTRSRPASREVAAPVSEPLAPAPRGAVAGLLARLGLRVPAARAAAARRLIGGDARPAGAAAAVDPTRRALVGATVGAVVGRGVGTVAAIAGVSSLSADSSLAPHAGRVDVPPLGTDTSMHPGAPIRFAPERTLLSALYITGDGAVAGHTGTPLYSRGYAQQRAGPLRTAHGSPAPATRLAPQSGPSGPPGAALDRMCAHRHGVRVAVSGPFSRFANEPTNFDPTAERWQGKCHSWSWTALHPALSALVDVQGAVGLRGRWFMGEWLSRADLGVWLMALASPLMDFALEAESALLTDKPDAMALLKAAGSMMQVGGPGVIGDVSNDAVRGTRETWNQPFFAASMAACTIVDKDAQLLNHLRAAHPGVQGVKRVDVIAFWGNEHHNLTGADDGHEGAPDWRASTFRTYAGVGHGGVVLHAVMANDPRLPRGVERLGSDEVPQYLMTVPHDILDAALSGAPHPALDAEIDGGRRGDLLRFFVHEVLVRGVPGETRAAFEKALAAWPAAVPADDARVLVHRFPGVGAAYTDAQWAAQLAPRGLERAAFFSSVRG